ncbi:MAG: LysM peptidoglycan-binding domain-containing protein [Ruminococcaceae bacterium]|nr:LysM peptidoglycan-binding domain-containing protein [Oscillospiraceae bacterium]
MLIHTVERGDSVYSIAREYGIPPTRIITDNLLSNPGRLVVGQDLVILFPTVTHTVKGGETLERIAALYGISLLDMYRNNPILGGLPSIYPGQVLNISYDTSPLGEISSNGYAYLTIDQAVLRRTLPYLTYLSVFSYGIRDDGGLIPPEGDEEGVLNLAREYGTVPLLVLTSLTERGTFSSKLAAEVLANEELANVVINSVVTTVAEKGYGGVDVDFEYIPAEYSSAYANFIARLSDALGEEYRVFVSLAPKYRADQPGLLYGGHDYGLLGEAADNVLLMTYEWGYTYGPPLPVSPINEVRRVIDYAVTEIPREKIFVGIPNYGYDWPLPYVRGESKARSLGNVEAVQLALDRGVAIEYDDVAQAPYFTYYDRPETYDDAVEHIVWFGNARSSDAMLRLVSEYGLDGAGVWNIMKYFPALWSVMNSLYTIRKL